MGPLTIHLGMKHKWNENEFGPIIMAMLDDLVDKIIQMTEAHIGCSVKERSTPAQVEQYS